MIGIPNTEELVSKVVEYIYKGKDADIDERVILISKEFDINVFYFNYRSAVIEIKKEFNIFINKRLSDENKWQYFLLGIIAIQLHRSEKRKEQIIMTDELIKQSKDILLSLNNTLNRKE